MYRPRWCCFLTDPNALERALTVLREVPGRHMGPVLSILPGPTPRQFAYRHPPNDGDLGGAVALIEGVTFDTPVTLDGWPRSYGTALALCPLRMGEPGADDYLAWIALNLVAAQYDENPPFPVWHSGVGETGRWRTTRREGRRRLFDYDGYVMTPDEVARQDLGDGFDDPAHP